MKKEKYQKYIAGGLAAFCVIAASILLFFLLDNLNSIRSAVKSVLQIVEPFILGVVIAYLLAPLYDLLMRELTSLFSRRLSPTVTRHLAVGVSLFCSILAVLLITIGLFALVVPRFISSLFGIVNSLDLYSNNISAWLEDVLGGYPDVETQVAEVYESVADYFISWVNSQLTPSTEAMLSSLGDLSVVLEGVLSGVKIVVRVVKDYIIGMIVSAYLLVAKRRMIAQAKKIVYSLFHQSLANSIIYECRYVQDVFGGFVRGKLLDSLIMGVLCFIGCMIFRFPYPIVVSVIVGCTNVIPFFGPFFGAIPCGVLILLVSPIKCLYFVIFILALQQFDGNVLGPKILGNTTGLSSFWVLFSIILFGGLFGFIGMIIAVPLFAVIYSVIAGFVDHRLKKRDMPTDTEAYELLDRVDESSETFIYMRDPEVKETAQAERTPPEEKEGP